MGKDQSNSVLSADARANETQEATIWKWSVYPQSHDVHFFGQCQRTKSKIKNQNRREIMPLLKFHQKTGSSLLFRIVPQG